MSVDLSTLLHVNLRCINFHLRRATRCIGKIYDDALRPTGLRDTYFHILVKVGLHTAPLTLEELSEEMSADSRVLDRNVSRMESKGWLQLTNDDPYRIKLTDSGREVLGEALPIWRDLQARLRRLLGTVEFNSLVSTADSLVQYVKETNEG